MLMLLDNWNVMLTRLTTWVIIDTSTSYLLFQTLLPLFWTLTCIIWMELTRTDDVFSRIAMVLFLYLSVTPWSRTKFYKLRVQKEKPAVFASHPHTVGPAHRSSGNACGVAFSLTSGTTVEQADYRQTPTSPTARWLRKQEGEEMAVARTPRKLVSDGTRVDGVCRIAKHEC